MGQHECTAEPFNGEPDSPTLVDIEGTQPANSCLVTPPLESNEQFEDPYGARNKFQTPPPVDTRGASKLFKPRQSIAINEVS